MKKFLPLLLCLLLSIFTVARATKPALTPAPDTKTAQKKPTAQEADAKTLLNDANSYEYYVDKPLRADYVGLTDWIAGYNTKYYRHRTTQFRTTGRGSIQVSKSTKTSPFLNQYPRRKSVRKNLTPKANPSICLTPRRNKSLPRKTPMNK